MFQFPVFGFKGSKIPYCFYNGVVCVCLFTQFAARGVVQIEYLVEIVVGTTRVISCGRFSRLYSILVIFLFKSHVMLPFASYLYSFSSNEPLSVKPLSCVASPGFSPRLLIAH